MHLDSDKRIFYDNIAEEWDRLVTHRPDKLKFIAEVLSLSPGQRVLDIGCGTGVMIPYLLKGVAPGGSVDALDFSPKMIEVARRKYPEDKHPGLRYFVNDINQVNIDTDYDVILCYSTFASFTNQRDVLERLTRGLRPGGRLVIAHGESRQAINDEKHVEMGFLPPLEKLTLDMLEAGLHVGMNVDTEEMFLVTGHRH